MADRSTTSISIAMCTFNGAAFLPEQLTSIAGQSRPPEEMVVCDDDSTDGTRTIVEAFAREAPFRVRLVLNAQRLGTARNFDKAISMCRGRLIALSDQDDVWHPDKLLSQERALRAQAVGAVFTDAEVVGDDLVPLGYRLWGSVGFSRAAQRRVRDGRALSVLLRRDVVTGATLMFSSRYKDAIRPVPDGWMHDSWIAFVVASMGGLGLVERPLLRYRLHATNQIGASPPMRQRAGFQERLSLAKHADRAVLEQQLERYRVAQQRLEALGVSADVIADVEAKMAHLQRRARLPRGASRVPVILQELASGRYGRWSPGLQSAAKDLLLR